MINNKIKEMVKNEIKEVIEDKEFIVEMTTTICNTILSGTVDIIGNKEMIENVRELRKAMNGWEDNFDEQNEEKFKAEVKWSKLRDIWKAEAEKEFADKYASRIDQLEKAAAEATFREKQEKAEANIREIEERARIKEVEAEHTRRIWHGMSDDAKATCAYDRHFGELYKEWKKQQEDQN